MHKDVPSWIMEVSDLVLRGAVANDDLRDLLAQACEQLLGHGIPLWRVSLSMRAIDPTVRALSFVWRPGTDVATDETPYMAADEDEAAYGRSPIVYMLSHDLQVHCWQLERGEGCDVIPILAELRQQGATHYVMWLVRFGGPTTPALPGMALGVATDRLGGFGGHELAALDALLPTIGLAACRFALTRTASELLSVYLGPMTAQRVLAGEVHRGTGRAIDAAILIADLRGFTALASREDPLCVVRWLDQYLEAIGGSLSDHGGEVLKFLGDGLLAVFPEDGPDGEQACVHALAAAQETLARTAALNAARRKEALPALALDIALHRGEVVYGNVGAARRLDFTVIGRAVNEASRIEGLCERLGRSLLFSASFAARCRQPVLSLGCFRLRGIDEELEVLTLDGGPAGYRLES